MKHLQMMNMSSKKNKVKITMITIKVKNYYKITKSLKIYILFLKPIKLKSLIQEVFFINFNVLIIKSIKLNIKIFILIGATYAKDHHSSVINTR